MHRKLGWQGYLAGFLIVVGAGAAAATIQGHDATATAPAASVAPATSSSATSTNSVSDSNSNATPFQSRALLESFSEAFRDAAHKVDPSVVAIVNEHEVQGASYQFGPGEQQGPFGDFLRRFFEMPGGPQGHMRSKSLGSGVIVSRDGYILTNNHVVKDADKLTVEYNGDRYPAKVIGTDPDTDLAVVKIDAKDLPAATLGDSKDLQVGEWVIAVGNPLDLKHTVTAGIVSATGRSDIGITDYEDFIQTDASINPGNSGGALADLDGNVVGINTAIASPSGGNIGIGFAIPIDMAKHVMQALMTHGSVSRGYLAMLPQDLDPDLAKALGLQGQKGALVGDVTPGGPADQAGLKRGDVIVSFDGKKVEDANDLRNLVAAASPGSKAEIGVIRDGKSLDLATTLKQRPEQIAKNSGGEQGGQQSDQRLGLSVAPMTPELASRLGVDRKNGVVVEGVEQGSRAAEAGLRPGDVIIGVGHKDVASVDDLRAALGKLNLDGPVALVVQRGDLTFYAAVPAA